MPPKKKTTPTPKKVATANRPPLVPTTTSHQSAPPTQHIPGIQRQATVTERGCVITSARHFQASCEAFDKEEKETESTSTRVGNAFFGDGNSTNSTSKRAREEDDDTSSNDAIADVSRIASSKGEEEVDEDEDDGCVFTSESSRINFSCNSNSINNNNNIVSSNATKLNSFAEANARLDGFLAPDGDATAALSGNQSSDFGSGGGGGSGAFGVVREPTMLHGHTGRLLPSRPPSASHTPAENNSRATSADPSCRASPSRPNTVNKGNSGGDTAATKKFHKYAVVLDLDETLIYGRDGDLEARAHLKLFLNTLKQFSEPSYVPVATPSASSPSSSSTTSKSNSKKVMAAAEDQPQPPESPKMKKEHDGLVEVIIWTAGERSYAKAVVKELNISGLIKHCIYRDQAWFHDAPPTESDDEEEDDSDEEGIGHGYTKYLRLLNRPMDYTLIIENTPDCVRKNPENGIIVSDFEGNTDPGGSNPKDATLLKLSQLIRELVQDNNGMTVPDFLHMKSKPLSSQQKLGQNSQQQGSQGDGVEPTQPRHNVRLTKQVVEQCGHEIPIYFLSAKPPTVLKPPPAAKKKTASRKKSAQDQDEQNEGKVVKTNKDAQKKK